MKYEDPADVHYVRVRRERPKKGIVARAGAGTVQVFGLYVALADEIVVGYENARGGREEEGVY